MNQHFVPSLMPVAVVNTFEMVEIHLDHREGLILSLTAGGQRFGLLKEGTPVMQTGQGIMLGLPL